MQKAAWGRWERSGIAGHWERSGRRGGEERTRKSGWKESGRDGLGCEGSGKIRRGNQMKKESSCNISI